MNNLASSMRRGATNNAALTTNGDKAFKSTLNPLLDAYYKIPSLRGDTNSAMQIFKDAWAADRVMATVFAFHLRDAREGKGERATFRAILKFIHDNDPKIFGRVVDFVPFYGRWDDMLEFSGNADVREFVRAQLLADCASDKPSLLAKWMPSENASSLKTVALARQWISVLGVTPKYYRKMLAKIRAKLKVVEVAMSSGEFAGINYSGVPSNAMKRYGRAFGRNDSARFTEFLTKAEKGEVKINASVLYPYELWSSLRGSKMIESQIEAQWKALPDFTGGENAIVMADVSGSMQMHSFGSFTALDVSMSLAVYFAQRSKGPFKGTYMTFSDEPKIMTISPIASLRGLHSQLNTNDCSNTNLDAAFALMLSHVVRSKAKQEEIPSLYIISDMQFDGSKDSQRLSAVDRARMKWAAKGYELPKIVHWNVGHAAKNNVPSVENDNGVIMVGGFSASTFKNLANAKAVTPYDAMLEVLNGERYAPVVSKLKSK